MTLDLATRPCPSDGGAMGLSTRLQVRDRSSPAPKRGIVQTFESAAPCVRMALALVAKRFERIPSDLLKDDPVGPRHFLFPAVHERSIWRSNGVAVPT